MTLRLEDMELIRQVTYRYFRSVDTGDFDAVEGCFTEDASVAFFATGTAGSVPIGRSGTTVTPGSTSRSISSMNSLV